MDDNTKHNLIRQWHREELGRQRAPLNPQARLVMGCPLWGERYVERFLSHVLPTLMSSREALDAYGWEMVLYVDEPALKALERCTLTIPLLTRLIPSPIMDILRDNAAFKYAVLSATQNVLVNECARRGAAFHMLVADIVYSHNYLGRLIKLGQHYDGVAHNGLVVVSDAVTTALEPYRKGVAIDVPARDLGQLCWEHCVPQWASYTMDGIEDPLVEMPNSHLIHWRTENGVRIHSAHMTATWISPRRCGLAGGALGGTIDSELPRYIGPNFYIPQLIDDMAIAALDASRDVPVPRVSFIEFKNSLMQLIGGRQDFLAYFRHPGWLPAKPVGGFPSNETIELRFQRLMALLEA